MKKFIREIEPNRILYRDDKTGIAWIEDGYTGCGISIHPNIDASGSVKGMKNLGYWGKEDRTVRSHGFIYNIDHVSFSWSMDKDNPYHDLELLVLNECECKGCLERKSNEVQI